jgi:hypothetical protein
MNASQNIIPAETTDIHYGLATCNLHCYDGVKLLKTIPCGTHDWRAAWVEIVGGWVLIRSEWHSEYYRRKAAELPPLSSGLVELEIDPAAAGDALPADDDERPTARAREITYTGLESAARMYRRANHFNGRNLRQRIDRAREFTSAPAQKAGLALLAIDRALRGELPPIPAPSTARRFRLTACGVCDGHGYLIRSDLTAAEFPPPRKQVTCWCCKGQKQHPALPADYHDWLATLPNIDQPEPTKLRLHAQGV